VSVEANVGTNLVAPISKKDYPLTFWCEDFEGECCKGWCHSSDDFAVMRKRLITVYPESIHSVPHQNKMPDFTLGISAEVCCARYELVRQLPRSWWIRKYGGKRGYSEEHIGALLNATPQNYFRVMGELADIYSKASGARPTGRSEPYQRRSVGIPAGARKVSRTCVACGASIGRSDDMCSSCGEPQ